MVWRVRATLGSCGFSRLGRRWPGPSRCGERGLNGWARHGEAGDASWRPVKAGRVPARSGSQGLATRGGVTFGSSWQSWRCVQRIGPLGSGGMAVEATLGFAGRLATRLGLAVTSCPGVAGPGSSRRCTDGRARRGCSLHGAPRLGSHGAEWFGMDRQVGRGSQRKDAPGRPWPGGARLVLAVTARHGRYGTWGIGSVRCGLARHRPRLAGRGSLVRSRIAGQGAVCPGPFLRLARQSRPDEAPRGPARFGPVSAGLGHGSAARSRRGRATSVEVSSGEAVLARLGPEPIGGSRNGSQGKAGLRPDWVRPGDAAQVAARLGSRGSGRDARCKAMWGSAVQGVAGMVIEKGEL